MIPLDPCLPFIFPSPEGILTWCLLPTSVGSQTTPSFPSTKKGLPALGRPGHTGLETGKYGAASSHGSVSPSHPEQGFEFLLLKASQICSRKRCSLSVQSESCPEDALAGNGAGQMSSSKLHRKYLNPLRDQCGNSLHVST